MFNTKKHLFFLLFLSSLSLLVGTTYAWVTSKDEHINRFSSPEAKIKISIEGKKNPLFLMPGQVNDRNIAVQNNSEQPVFVRVSLKEVLASFYIDVEDKVGNGNIKDYSGVTPQVNPSIKKEDISTWKEDDYFQVGNKIIKMKKVESYSYQTGIRSEYMKSVKANMPNVADKLDVNKSDYWLYENGYYYYSERLLPNDLSSVFMGTVIVDKNLPNSLKGSLYHQDYLAEGVLASDIAFDAWQLPMDSPVRELLNKQL